MRTALVFLLVAIVLALLVESRRHKKHRRERPGYRRRVINDDDSDEDDDFHFPIRRRPFRHRPWSGRFNLGLFNNRRRWFDFDLAFDFDSKKPWYEGPHVCTRRDVIKNETDGTEISSHHTITTQICDDKGTSYKCTSSLIVGEKEQITVVIKECCPGYTRRGSQHGCPTVHEIKDILKTAEDLKLNKFLEAADLVGIKEELKNGNVTVFAPVDDAFDELSKNMAPVSQLDLQDSGVLMVSQPLIDNVVSDLKATLMGHLVPGVYSSNRLVDEQLINTVSPYKNKIRINFYDELMTANCIKVTKRDNTASNGIIHVMEKTLEPVSKTLVDIISSNSEMSYLKTAIGKSGLRKKLAMDGQYTLFAPTDAAFRKLDSAFVSRLLDGDEECVVKLLQNHILPNVICSAAIKGRSKSKNVLNHMLNLTKDDDGKLFINGAQAVSSDVVATNGVMYVIDEVLVPDEALDVLQIARKSGATAFANLVAETGLAKTLQTVQNLTLFIPSNDVLQDINKLPTDPAELMEILTYHVVPNELNTCNMFNGDQLDTLNGKQLRFHEYTTAFPFFKRGSWGWDQTVQCASIQKPNIRACNGIIHTIDRIIKPPKGNILDALAYDSRFSELVELVKIAGIGDTLEEDGPFTVFAPTNEAFRAMDQDELRRIVNDKDELKKLLLNHVAREHLCCSGLKLIGRSNPFNARRLKMLSGESFSVDHSALMLGQAEIKECDLVSNNGVIHALEKVITTDRMYPEYTDFWSDWLDSLSP